MENCVLQVENLTKSYQNASVVDDVTFEIQKGEIFGLIGENGAGKTTLMRMIAGSSNPTKGQIVLFGKTANNLEQSRKNMGVLIENPACYSDMSAFEHLEIIRLAKDIPDKSVVLKALEMVGLSDVRNRRVGKFSFGMRQRLGIAMALIGSPKFLVLDEPINGLDPNGIIDIRNIILRLKKEYGITFFISSHILTELHQVATNYAILHKGKLIAQHTAKELEEQCESSYIIKYQGNVNELKSFLREYQVKIVADENGELVFKSMEEIPDNFLQILMQQKYNNLSISDYRKERESLEQYFVRVTNERRKSDVKS